jgi:flagellar basal-body rod protein FlgB
MSALFDDNTVGLVRLALDASSLRHQAIAHNIANASQQGFQPVQVNFSSHLAQARAAVNARPMEAAGILSDYRAGLNAMLSQPASGSSSVPVALDVEVAQLSENTLHQHALVKSLKHHFSLLNTAISEGKR